MKRYMVTLTEDERQELGVLISKGRHRSQKVLNALILLGCDRGEFQTERSTNEDMARVLNISMRKIDRLKKRFVMDGLEVALNGTKGSRIYTKKADGDFEAHLVAISCSEPPEGFARWSLRLLADKVVELSYVDNISHETVRRVLKKRNQALAAKRMGNSAGAKWELCCADGDGAGRLQAPVRFTLPCYLHGRISKATDRGNERFHPGVAWAAGKVRL